MELDGEVNLPWIWVLPVVAVAPGHSSVSSLGGSSAASSVCGADGIGTTAWQSLVMTLLHFACDHVPWYASAASLKVDWVFEQIFDRNLDLPNKRQKEVYLVVDVSTYVVYDIAFSTWANIINANVLDKHPCLNHH